MDLRQLTAAIAVAETGSVTRAAALLRTVQPAITRQIQSLERDLGAELFLRSRHGMHPTKAGATFVEYARRALAELERARIEIRPDPEELQGMVTVGLLASTADLLAGPLVARVREQHPQVWLRITAGYAGDVTGWLETGAVDTGLTYRVNPSAAIELRPLVEEPLWAVAPVSVGLDATRPIAFAEVARHPLVMPSSSHGLRRLVNAASAKSGTHLNVVVETNAVSVQRRLVIAGHGWTVLPGITVLEDIAHGLISAAPLTDGDLTRHIALALPRRAELPRAVRAVASILVEEIDLAIREGRWPSSTWLPGRDGGPPPETSARPRGN